MGWILLGFAVALAALNCAGAYAVLVYRFGHGALPLGPVAVLLGLLWAPATVLIPLAGCSARAAGPGTPARVDLDQTAWPAA